MFFFSCKFISFFLFSTPLDSTINSHLYLPPKIQHSSINKLINFSLPITTIQNKKLAFSEKITLNFSDNKTKIIGIPKIQKVVQVLPPTTNSSKTTNIENKTPEKLNDFFYVENLSNFSSKISDDLKGKKITELKKNLDKKTDLKKIKEKFTVNNNANTSSNLTISDEEKKAQVAFMMSYEELANLKDNFRKKLSKLNKTESDSEQKEKEKNNEVIKAFIGSSLETKIKETNFFNDLLTDFWAEGSPNFDLRKEFIDEKMYIVVGLEQSSKLSKLFKNSKKNYSCAQENNILDKYCEIYDFLASNYSTNGKNTKIKSKAYLKTNDLLTQEKISESNKKFVIRLSKKKYEPLEKEKKDTFKVQTNDKSESVELSKKAVLETGLDQEFKSKSSVVKVVKVEGKDKQIQVSETYNCTVNSKEYQCKLKKIDTQKNVEKFHEITKEKLKNNIEKLEIDDYYFLSFAENSFSIEEYKKGLIKISNSSKTEIGSVFFKEMFLTSKEDPKEFIFVKEDNKTLLVSMNLPTTEKNKNVGDETLLIDGWQKQYKCSWKNKQQQQEVDENCEIQILGYAESTKASSVQNAISYSPTLKKQSELKEKSLYKLIIKNDDVFLNKSHEDIPKITLSKKTDSQALATLTAKFSIEEQKIVGKTDLILGRIDTWNESIPTVKNCTFGTKESKCSLYIFDNSYGGINFAKDFKYEYFKLITQKNNANDFKLIVLKFEDPDFDLVSNASEKVITLQETQTPVNIITPLVGFINGVGKTNIIYINNNYALKPPVKATKQTTPAKKPSNSSKINKT